jgi:histidyl-tRNA synthetase
MPNKSKQYNSLRGVRDILPDDVPFYRQVEEAAQNTLNAYNYKEIRIPLLEQSSLYTRTAGKSSDVVSKEMYSFCDRKGRDISLRPEGTAGLVRAYIENKMYLSNPIQKLWYIGEMFRYERPQAGRYRQFSQLGIEMIGVKNPYVDAEVIAIISQIFEQLNLPGFKLIVNSIGSAEDRLRYQKDLVDYLNLYQDELDADLRDRLQSNPLRILDSKNQDTQKIL